jgi:transposase-like protein
MTTCGGTSCGPDAPRLLPTTMHAVRAELQRSKASVAALAEHYGINPKTVLKWRRRASVQDRPMGPKAARPTVLTLLEEAAIVAFRQQTPLPLDDVLFALQPQIPHLTRSSLHRLLERHGISRLPKAESGKAEKERFKSDPIGYFHLDICEVRCEEGKLFLYVAIDRTSKFADAELHPEATRPVATQVLANLIGTVPYRIHTVLTDTAFSSPISPAHPPTACTVSTGYAGPMALSIG